MTDPTAFIFLLLILLNLISFCFYAYDKWASRRGRRRIRERTLLLLAAFMGALGALLGMELLRHKTKHLQFRILVPLFLLLRLAICIFLYMKYGASVL